MLCVRCLESNIRSDLVFRASHWLSLGHWPIRGNQSRVESEKSVLTSILGLIWFSRLPIGRRWITSQSEATKVESCQIRPGGVPFCTENWIRAVTWFWWPLIGYSWIISQSETVDQGSETRSSVSFFRCSSLIPTGHGREISSAPVEGDIVDVDQHWPMIGQR